MGKGIISILGCGWLGLPLGKHLIDNGFRVKGSVTNPEKFDQLKSQGIMPFRIVAEPSKLVFDDSDFFGCEVLVISIPPRRIEGIQQIYPAQIAQIIPFILKSGIKRVLFISSTSVYPEDLIDAVEDVNYIPDKDSGKAILLAENLLIDQPEFRTTILRFGGLIGADRNPARFLSKASNPIPNTPVNLIHQDDCIGIIAEIIRQNLWGETLNACCPEHPLKKDFYGKAARISGLPEPMVEEIPKPSKKVDSSKLFRMLSYQFKYSSPMDYLDDWQHVKSIKERKS